MDDGEHGARLVVAEPGLAAHLVVLAVGALRVALSSSWGRTGSGVEALPEFIKKDDMRDEFFRHALVKGS